MLKGAKMKSRALGRNQYHDGQLHPGGQVSSRFYNTYDILQPDCIYGYMHRVGTFCFEVLFYQTARVVPGLYRVDNATRHRRKYKCDGLL